MFTWINIHLHLEGDEEIFSEPIPHTKYTRAIYPYIKNSVRYLPRLALKEGFVPLRSYILITIYCVDDINLYILRRSACNPHPPRLEVCDHNTAIIYIN